MIAASVGLTTLNRMPARMTKGVMIGRKLPLAAAPTSRRLARGWRG